jgi:ornithine cyclodeaminase/alanine dehydrogenase-like protein (mu-crystallin family)
VDEAEDLGFTAVAYTEPHVAVKEADIIVTLTSAREPLFPPDGLGDDVVICALGSTKADRVEIDPEVTRRASRVIVDSLEGSRHECGDLIAAQRAGAFDWQHAEELPACLADGESRERLGGLILFESQGLALQDVVAGGVALRHL